MQIVECSSAFGNSEMQPLQFLKDWTAFSPHLGVSAVGERLAKHSYKTSDSCSIPKNPRVPRHDDSERLSNSFEICKYNPKDFLRLGTAFLVRILEFPFFLQSASPFSLFRFLGRIVCCPWGRLWVVGQILWRNEFAQPASRQLRYQTGIDTQRRPNSSYHPDTVRTG